MEIENSRQVDHIFGEDESGKDFVLGIHDLERLVVDLTGLEFALD